MTRRFVKMSGAGNDFVLIEGPLRRPQDAARRLCERRRGVGADGLLVLERGSRKKAPRLSYYNADGSAAFCGNGSRCAAWWMFQNSWVRSKNFSFDTNVGSLRARITGPGRAAIRMPSPRLLRRGVRLKAGGKSYRADEIDSGVPHAVVAVKGLVQFPVVSVGKLLRFHKAFAPKGANVDFIEPKGDRIMMRTYERGVEDETLACGTGAVAAAVAFAAGRKNVSSVPIFTRGGDRLTVSFSKGDVWLEGPADAVFEGTVAL